MQLYAPENAGKYVWQCADAKTRAVTYTANNCQSPPPDAAYGHPIGRYDSDGVFWTFCPNAAEEDPNSPRSSRFAKHPLGEEEQRKAVKEKVWGKLSSMGSYKETEF
jgi:hypothetical protein